MDGKRVSVPIFKGKGDVRSCSAYRVVKLLEHGMKLLKECWRNIREVVNIDGIQFSFMPGRGTSDALFILKMQKREEAIYGFCGYWEGF